MTAFGQLSGRESVQLIERAAVVLGELVDADALSNDTADHFGPPPAWGVAY